MKDGTANHVLLGILRIIRALPVHDQDTIFCELASTGIARHLLAQVLLWWLVTHVCAVR